MFSFISFEGIILMPGDYVDVGHLFIKNPVKVIEKLCEYIKCLVIYTLTNK